MITIVNKFKSKHSASIEQMKKFVENLGKFIAKDIELDSHVAKLRSKLK